MKYVRFKNNTGQLEQNKVQELVKSIEATMKLAFTQPLPQPTEQHTLPTPIREKTEVVKSTSFDANKPVQQWTVDDINLWFSNYKVPENLLKLYDFQSADEMNQYARKLRIDPSNEFTKYERLYAKAYPAEVLEEYIFNRLKNALLNLPNCQNETFKTSISSPEIAAAKSRACTIS